jgi:hypothetical protein
MKTGKTGLECRIAWLSIALFKIWLKNGNVKADFTYLYVGSRQYEIFVRSLKEMDVTCSQKMK